MPLVDTLILELTCVRVDRSLPAILHTTSALSKVLSAAGFRPRPLHTRSRRSMRRAGRQ